MANDLLAGFRAAADKTKRLIDAGKETLQGAVDDLEEMATEDNLRALLGAEVIDAIIHDVAAYAKAQERVVYEYEEDPKPNGPNGSQQPTSRGGKGPYKLDFFGDLDIQACQKLFLIADMIGRHEQSCWFGAPESGKSTVVIDVCCHIAANVPYYDRQTKHGCVLYVAAERGMNVKRRMIAWRMKHGLTKDAAKRMPLAVIDDAVDLRNGTMDADRIIAAARELSAAFGNLEVVLIVFDTLSRVLAGGDESSSKDMGSLAKSVDRIFRETNAHCALIHHEPYAADRMRGHGLMPGAMDTTVRIEKNADKVVVVEVVKASDLPDDTKPRLFFQFESEILMNEPLMTASVMVQAADYTPPADKKKKRGDPVRAPEGVDAVRQALDHVISKEGTLIRPTNELPQLKCAQVKRVRQVAIDDYGLSAGAEVRAKQTMFTRSLAYLKKLNVVGFTGQFVWFVDEPTNKELPS